jgi:hypothetical protein
VVCPGFGNGFDDDDDDGDDDDGGGGGGGLVIVPCGREILYLA